MRDIILFRVVASDFTVRVTRLHLEQGLDGARQEFLFRNLNAIQILVDVSFAANVIARKASAQGTSSIAHWVHEVAHVRLEAGTLHGTVVRLRS